MAVLATLQDADVLPPEGTPDANRVIKAVIQFQSVFLKSGDPAVQLFLTQALTTQGECGADKTLSRFRSAGWTSEVLEALSEQWATTAIDQREQFGAWLSSIQRQPERFRFVDGTHFEGTYGFHTTGTKHPPGVCPTPAGDAGGTQ